jgi:hypothetical protein
LFRRQDITALLREAGFVVREARDFSFTANPLLGKVKTWWVAQKLGQNG